MSLLSGAIHAIGDVAAPVLKGAGAITGDQSLYNYGAAINNPNIVLSNPGNILPDNSASAFGVAAHPAGSAAGAAGQPGGQPNANTVPGGSGTYYASGGAGPAAPAVNPNQFQIDQVNSALGRLPTQLDIARGNIQGQFNTGQNEINTGEQQAQGQYDQSKAQNTQQYVQNKNTIQNSASSGLHSLLRLLGMHGAGGSSDYTQAAPQAIATQASQQRSGAGQTYGQNAQGLDTNWNNYESGVGQSKQKLNDWLSSQLNSVQAQSDNTHAGLLQNLAGLQGTMSLAQPYIDQSNSLLGQVDQLGKLNPTYDGKAPTYTAPSVASYQVQPNAPIQQNGPSGSALDNLTSPFWSLLQNKDKTQNQLTPSF